MTRLIDADALKKEVRELPNENTDYIYLDLVDREVVQTLISEAPTVERTQWVSCSERLPDRLGDYLVSDKYGDVYSTNLDYLREGEKCFGYYGDDGFFIKNDTVIAWQPLPEPYKEEDERR